jgi:predicted O-linked N-acetylglucosamine transferase (SPINDLY family)
MSSWNELLESARRSLDACRFDDAHAELQTLLMFEFPETSEALIPSHHARLRFALDLAEACADRSDAMIRSNQMEQGLPLYELAISLRADIAQLHERLGDTHAKLFEIDDAIAAYQSATRLVSPDDPVHQKLRDALAQKRDPAHVVARCRIGAERSPDSAEAQLQLANALRANRQLDEAIETYQRVMELSPDSPVALNNLAVALKDAGRVEEAYDRLTKAAAAAPDWAVIQSNALYTSYFLPKDDPQLILEAHRKWGDRITPPKHQDFANDRSPDRVLSIGYVSPDFREHCQSFFTLPLLSAHDRTKVKVFCYADVPRPDEITERLKSHADVWRDIQGLSDARVAEQIRADRIDILVDLTMHMAKGRPMLFAMKPAPIQIAWLAYPGTTGSAAMDYRFSDPYLDPPGSDADYTEQTLRLPETFWCYDPLEPEGPASPLPALSAGYISFGCMNNFCKVNQPTLALWREVLERVPNSRLILLAPFGEARQRVTEALAVDSARVQFMDYLPRPQYLKLYERIDVCLDTFPYNGHTTSLDAMWMGVPVVSLAGRVAVSRAGLSLASKVGLQHLVAQSCEEFAPIAKSLTEDLSKLADLRATLRQRMESSPLMDSARFARAVENCYRTAWTKCGRVT